MQKEISYKKIENLYYIAADNDITVFENCPKNIIGMAAKYPEGIKFISLLDFDSLDTSEFYDEKRKRFYTKLEVFAHEIGHCLTDSFYLSDTPYLERCKQEAQAERWSYEYVIPFSELCEAVQEGNFELWELAEYFNVSENFIKEAIEYYATHNKLVPKELYSDD